MKKFLLMFAAVAAIAFVGCKTETKPAEEVTEEAPVAEYTVESVTNDLMNAADEATAVSLLDGIKAKAEELLAGGDQNGYFNIINILKSVFENNKEALLAKIPALADKLDAYITVPEELKAGFAEFAAKAVADAAVEKAGEAVDAAGEAVAEKAADVKEAAGEAVDAAKDKAADAIDKAADKAKEAIK